MKICVFTGGCVGSSDYLSLDITVKFLNNQQRLQKVKAPSLEAFMPRLWKGLNRLDITC